MIHYRMVLPGNAQHALGRKFRKNEMAIRNQSSKIGKRKNDAEAMNCWNCGASAKERMVFEMPLNVMKDCACNWPNERMNQWIDDSMNQRINEWVNERADESVQRTSEPMNHWINGINEPMNKWFCESISQWINEPRAPTTVSSKFYCPHLKVFHSVLHTSIFFNNWKCKSISRYSPGQSCALFVDSFRRSRPAPAETETLYFGDLRGHITWKNTGFRAG